MHQRAFRVGRIRSAGPECLIEGVERQVGAQRSRHTPARRRPASRRRSPTLRRRTRTRWERRCRVGRATSAASGSPCVHATGGSACVCITRTRRSASTGPGSGAPVFTSDLRDQHLGCEHTGPLRHVTGLPGPGLLRVLRPIRPASAGNGPSRTSNRSPGSPPNYAPATSPRLRRRHSPWPPESATSTDQRVLLTTLFRGCALLGGSNPQGSSHWLS